MRAVAGRPCKVRFAFEAEDGTLSDVDSATTVAVTVKAGDGTTVVASGTAAHESTGVYAFVLNAQARLDTLTATAVGTVGGATYTMSEQVQLVDRRFVPLSVYRADPALASLPTTDFLRTVDAAENAITTELRFPPVLVGARVEWRTRECARLFVPGVFYPHELYTLTVYDEDQISDQIHIRDNAIERGFGFTYGTPFYDPIYGVAAVPWFAGPYKAWLSHGWESTPDDLGKAGVLLARHYAQTGAGTAYPDRATRIMTEASEIWLARPGSDSPFGLPEVDAAILRHRMPEPFADDPGAY